MPHHVVVDGSNIATEGRSLPSLAQLNEAVMAFMAEHPDALITVVVDATFGHRIDATEQPEFDEAIANNELVAPPAGAVGRGDAFVLSIANKVNATILTNDSYQEFHGQVDWLFDEGRLIGGKPVPHVGWVFVPRLPVRGAISRSAVKEAKRKRGSGTSAKSGATATVRQGSAAANQPMPVPKTPPPSARPAAAAKVEAPAPVSTAEVVAAAASATPKATAVNDFLPFLAFVENHPVGSSVNAVVENYSSHGAYVRVGDVKGYVPLRLMADPAPRSAREFMKIGDAVTLVVDSFAPGRRSIDLAVAGMSVAKPVEAPPVKAPRTRKRPPQSEPPVAEAAPESPPAVADVAPAKPARVTKTRAKKAAATVDIAEPATDVEPTPMPAPAPVKRGGRKRAAAVEPASEAPAPDAPASDAPAVESGAVEAGAGEAPTLFDAPVAAEPAPAAKPAKPAKRGSKKAAAAPPEQPAAPPARAKRGAAKAAATAPADVPAATSEPARRRRRSS
jgi:hypothetical protein